ncbi:MAG: hypothetical protein Q8K37_05365 [Alphaproteobacteria bacterium]|nr:hypothetical protein [Alphaproteobacteria bacterium]
MVKLYPLWQNLPIQIGLVTCFIISFFPFLPTRSFFNNWRMALLWFIIGWLLASLKSLKQADKIDNLGGRSHLYRLIRCTEKRKRR